MAQNQRGGEVVVKLNDSSSDSSQKINSGSPSSNNFQGSPAKFMSPRNESLRRRNKELPNQENGQRYLNLGEEFVRCSSNVSFRRDSWKSVMSMTKSRLIDPPEESCPSSERVVNSGRMPEKEQDCEDDDIDDIPQEYKRRKFSTLTLLQYVLASTFHVNTFFERIQEALFNQYVIKTLSSPPLFKRHEYDPLEEGAMAGHQELEKVGVTVPGEHGATLPPRSRRVIGSGRLQKSPTVGKNSRFSRSMSKRQDEEISVDHLHKLNQKNISAWNMRKMVNIIRHGALSTLDEQLQNSNIEDEALLQIRSECQAKEAAKRIFQNVAKPGSQHICLEDVWHFMGKEEALKTMRLFGVAAENQGISKSFLKDWMVNAFRERRALALSLNDTKTAVDELHNLLNILVAIIILIIWLIILGVRITHFLVLISSQLLLVVFMFGNTCRTVFEAIIFLFIMHPFDVGDRCEVDGVQMVVEEMNILTTVFLKFDNQKIIYPNSILATKPISNYHRSPDMGDAIDFCIHIATPIEKVAVMKERITGYIESNNEHWQPAPMVIMREVIDMNKLMMSVWLTHRINYQDIKERWIRRALLVEEMIKVFRELDIEYRMLPLDVNVRNLPEISNRLPSIWKTCDSTSSACEGIGKASL
uniref:Mechanosensitive ion channel MscS domain-containing protein n=1 Tax=Fagus sylvatica TaxID=28930 RepID=A0A2N9FLT6_FAGSY